jgi:hypothetical protein
MGGDEARAETPKGGQDYPPALPPPYAQPIRCRWCGNMLGLVADGHYFGQHSERTYKMTLPGRVTCERRKGNARKNPPCGHETLINADGSTN